MINEDEKFRVQTAMALHGGSFVVKLAEALEVADPENQQKIKDTWPEYWETYKKLGASYCLCGNRITEEGLEVCEDCK